MTTGTDIIKNALKEIGAHSVVSPAAPESIEDGRKKLNSMLEMWLTRSIVIAFSPLEAAGDDLNEPADCYNGIVENLAIECASLFSNGKVIVTPDLRANAKRNFNNIKSLYGCVTVPNKVLSSTTPTGAGNSQNNTYSRTFWKQGAGVKN